MCVYLLGNSIITSQKYRISIILEYNSLSLEYRFKRYIGLLLELRSKLIDIVVLECIDSLMSLYKYSFFDSSYEKTLDRVHIGDSEQQHYITVGKYGFF